MFYTILNIVTVKKKPSLLWKTFVYLFWDCGSVVQLKCFYFLFIYVVFFPLLVCLLFISINVYVPMYLLKLTEINFSLKIKMKFVLSL